MKLELNSSRNSSELIEKKDSQDKQINKKRKNLIIAAIIGIFILSLVGVVVSFLLSRSSPSIQEIIKPNVKNHKFIFTDNSPFKYPFTLILSSDDDLVPKWKYSAFDTANISMNSSQIYFYYKNIISRTYYERNIKTGIDIDFSDSIGMELLASSINLEQFSLDYRNSMKKQTYKESIWLKYQDARIKLDQSSIKLDEFFINEIKKVLDSKKDYDEIQKDLVKLFNTYGYFVPIEFSVGGIISFIYEEQSLEKLNNISSRIQADIKGIVPGFNISYNENFSSFDTNLVIRYYNRKWNIWTN